MPTVQSLFYKCSTTVSTQLRLTVHVTKLLFFLAIANDVDPCISISSQCCIHGNMNSTLCCQWKPHIFGGERMSILGITLCTHILVVLPATCVFSIDINVCQSSVSVTNLQHHNRLKPQISLSFNKTTMYIHISSLYIHTRWNSTVLIKLSASPTEAA